jgi:hypothetical protein
LKYIEPAPDIYINYTTMQLLNTRTLGIIGILGSPWLLIDFINNGLYERFDLSSISGVRNFLFITGWTCCIIALYRMKAMGTKRWQKTIMIIQIVLLCLANCWNIWEIFAPNSPSFIYFLLNFTWPLAGCFMVVTGIVVLRAKKLKGWKRYIPLLAGLWFPQTLIIVNTVRSSIAALVLSGLYSALMFSLLGLSIVLNNYEPVVKRKIVQ